MMSEDQRKSSQLTVQSQLIKGNSKGESREIPPPSNPAMGSSAAPSVGPLASLSSPEPIAFRLPPQIIPTSVFPSSPELVTLYHPGIDRIFLALASYDSIPGPPVQYGIHHETVLTACKIVAGNRSGYLSSNRQRDAARVPASHSFLPSGLYYYHLDDSENGENYPIHRTFRTWSFPHNELPPSWFQKSRPNPPPLPWPASSTVASTKIKDRDIKCLVTGSKDYIASAHIIPEAENRWIADNKMELYLTLANEARHKSPFNLFSLRMDFHWGGFDQAQFVIVPKNGELVVHFLRENCESATLYHNIIFNHNNRVSHEALYARFAWALFFIIKETDLAKGFIFFEPEEDEEGLTSGPSREGGSGGRGGRRGGGGGGGSGGGRGSEGSGEGKRGRKGGEKSNKRKRDDEAEDGGSQSQRESTGGTQEPSQSTSGTKNPASPLQLDKWLTDIVYKVAPPETQSLLEADVHEIEEDMRSVAPLLPFLVDSSIPPDDHHYDNVQWYPGMKVVQRRKQAYIDAHPNIRASSGPFMEDDGGMSDNE